MKIIENYQGYKSEQDLFGYGFLKNNVVHYVYLYVFFKMRWFE